MKEKERDILADRPELKGMPYNLPEGYFDEFKAQMKPYGAHRSRRRLLPYVSVAASVALLTAAGLLLSQRLSPADEFTQEDFLVFSNSVSNSEYYESPSEQYAEAEIANDDIIDYLIYSGISAEEIEHYSNR